MTASRLTAVSVTVPVERPIVSASSGSASSGPASSGSDPGRPRLFWLAIGGEGALAIVGVAWAWAAGIALPVGPVATGLAAGVGSAIALAAIQLWLLRLAPDRGPVRALRRLYRDTLKPLFARVSIVDIVVISVCAGVGEELLFRGAVQGAWGLLAASLLFGLCHVGGPATAPLGLWAAIVGLYLGWLATVSGGLLAPIVAHAVYDALALSYIRWGRDDDAWAARAEGLPAPEPPGTER